MLRPILAFLTLCLAAFLLAPTVASVRDGVESLGIHRELPWRIWKWHEDPTPPPILPPDCDKDEKPLYSEVTEWPARIQKDQPFRVGGIVEVNDKNHLGVADIQVELFLNETKTLPGVPLGTAVTASDGHFELHATVPFEIEATRYHLVAHALRKEIDCKIYLEHWSDPEMDVLAKTRIIFAKPPRVVVGNEVNLSGALVDVVGAPVRNANVTVNYEGDILRVRTDERGVFTFNYTHVRPGNYTLSASYGGSKYYDESRGRTFVQVVEEDVRLDNAAGTGLTWLRSRQETLSGEILLRRGVSGGPVTVTIDGVRVIACPGCEASSTFTVTPDEEGRIRTSIVVPSDVAPGPFRLVVSGGGLRDAYAFPGRLYIPTSLSMAVEPEGFFSKAYRGNVTVTDEEGRALGGEVAVRGPAGWAAGPADSMGVFAFGAEPGCGAHPVQAFYNGTEYNQPATVGEEVRVCGYMAFIPAWALAVPWWGWVLLALVPPILLALVRRLRDRFATTISRGPPVSLAYVSPADAAVGVVGVGEAAVATAALEDELPAGYRLRMGTYRRMEDRPVGADLRADYAITPDALGEVPLRAEILDAKGRIVTRRTAVLKVVRYAEEIESRYLALRKDRVGEGADSVTPHEFEAWLMARSQGLDPQVLARLVRIFEEADYGPRDAGRPELVAYLEAENRLPEVTQPVEA